MGMAASQARLLSITARIHDVEYQAQQIQSRKLQLAMIEDEAYQKYNDALDATTLTFRSDEGTLVPATYNNLCGLNSINNGMSNKHYVFRTGDTDQVIVPDDVYEGCKKFGGEDPYSFAMYMMGVDEEKLKGAEEKYTNEVLGGDEDKKKELRDIVSRYAEAAGLNAEDLVLQVVDQGGGISALEHGNMVSIDNPNYAEAKSILDEYKASVRDYQCKLYLKSNGAERIYNDATETSGEYDYNTFQYYLRWGMLIEQEGGVEYCVSESEYGDGFGSDQEMLNGMLQTGRMIVDTVDIDKGTGKLKDSSATIGGDERLAYTSTTTIDKKALAKAEAEYEHTLKEVDRKDKRYDMDLNKLETERTALTTEYDSVKKVIQDNIDRTFKIFS